MFRARLALGIACRSQNQVYWSSSTRHMARSYQEAVEALNEFQTNASELEKQRQTGGRDLTKSIPAMRRFLERAEITQEKLRKLRVIHIAGSKGKGSTAAMTEALLRSQGYKTGLFTSPHLIEVRERIRINGKPLSREDFAASFWQLHGLLSRNQDPNMQWPTYFRTTCLLSFLAFEQHEVDVAILEVGIGGLYDSTNVVDHPAVCGIAHLGLEHTAILGNTLTEIATQKAGIMKPQVPVYTVPQQEEAMTTLQHCAKRAHVSKLLLAEPVQIVPRSPGETAMNLGIAGAHQAVNAGLALHLVREWLGKASEPSAVAGDMAQVSSSLSSLLPWERLALESCRWPGRTQILRRGTATYYIDGAHTIDSCTAAASWLRSVLPRTKSQAQRKFTLLFNVTGDRCPSDLLRPFVDLVPFDRAIFCPNLCTSSKANSTDQTNHTVSMAAQLRAPRACMAAFKGLAYLKLATDIKEKHIAADTLSCSILHADSISDALTAAVASDAELATLHAGMLPVKPAEPAVEPAAKRAKNEDEGLDSDGSVEHHIMITGSLHLVGGALSLLGCDVE
eukprot:m.71342 g.71342  ORF g.71342 m.71342 type:complete len:564 (-) comp14210_c0_seq3:35-1726(-)